ncbi:MFS transporter [Vibrio rumoiensis]|uniref:MFS transporter permease n=1 Tax=Vibrio rumoiensis 1S-45 TaxID=1188252 RepID=A0A1E5E6J8_9VIBR|nr:MFS transporter [Vibrio rumoiensis]OEF30132.1 MFS transporter permease [Vibrio rumoiensis 1S-45]
MDDQQANLKKVTFGLFIGSFISFCNLYLFQPLLPLIADHYSVSATRVNWVLAAATLTLSLSLVPWAIYSENIGRRKVMFISLYASPIVGLCMVFSDQLPLLVLSRALMGVALAGYVAVAVAYMAEEFSPKVFLIAVGSYIGANSLGGITGRIYGGIVGEHFGWQTAVIGMALFSLIIAILVTLWVPPQENFERKNKRLNIHIKEAVTHLKTPLLWIAMLIGGFNFALFVNLYTVMGFRLVAEPFSLPVGLVSLIFLCYLTGTLTSRLSGVWSLHFTPITGMFIGTLVSLLGMLIALIPSIIAMLVALLMISSGAFFTHSLAYAWVSSKAQTAKASATALYLVHYYAGGSLGGFYLIYCWQNGGWPMVVIGGGLLYTIILCLCYALKRQQRSQVTQSAYT